jgi:hypothetical protein
VQRLKDTVMRALTSLVRSPSALNVNLYDLTMLYLLVGRTLRGGAAATCEGWWQ